MRYNIISLFMALFGISQPHNKYLSVILDFKSNNRNCVKVKPKENVCTKCPEIYSACFRKYKLVSVYN